MPSATPDAEVPVYRIEHTMPDLRIPAAYRANAAADTADLPILTPGGDRDDPGLGTPRRRQQWGRDQHTRAMEMVPKPVSDRRVAMGRLAIIVTVPAWLSYLVTWSRRLHHRRPPHRGGRAEAVVYLITVTLLTGSALAYLLPARLLLPGARPPPVRGPPWSTSSPPGPSVTVIIPSYKEDARVIRTTVLSAALQDYPRLRVVLLIDDPPTPTTRRHRSCSSRPGLCPGSVQELLASRPPGSPPPWTSSRCAGRERPRSASRTWRTLPSTTTQAAAGSRSGRRPEIVDHTDDFFVDQVLCGSPTDFAPPPVRCARRPPTASCCR